MAEAAELHAETNSQQGAATATLRQTMVERQLRTFDVTDLPLLRRFLAVPRELFLPHDLAPLAYSDLALTLEDENGRPGRALLPPLVLARLLQDAGIRETDRVLDIAGGTFYSSALLSPLAREIVALEDDARLTATARSYLQFIGATNVRVETGPLTAGVPAAAPFDVIVVQGAVEEGLDRLFEQLTPDGRLLAIAKAEPDAGWAVTRFDRSGGAPAGARALFDASAPVLEGFEKAPGFVF
ncbi:protein-L-isoaspartate(D-aspartate) O-methyltransferase [Methylosinus sp. R-45379]|uniref:protein-L-isoaspartate O-methyltransferase family protein n=1 Tax=unclassified Methylosinus TaxID=2624500 RepID=UPI000463B810|nr:MULTISPECIES: protein-L-isoaspartate O-methyltransferase [unclassified Methylosinus]OAI30206.1 protein-L-isoaspartate(D-aspartate) O-methyltransferase [Methylosinus sp. R-45379]